MCLFFIGISCNDLFGGTFVPSPPGMQEQNRVKGSYNGWSAYVDFSFAFNDQLALDLGVRYTYDNKEFSQHALPVSSSLGPFFILGFTTEGFLTGAGVLLAKRDCHASRRANIR